MLKINNIQYSGVFSGVFEPLNNKRQHKNVSPSRLFQSLVNSFYIHSHEDASLCCFIFCCMNRPPLDKTRNHIALLFHFNWLKIKTHYYFNEIHWGKPHRIAISMKLLEITSRCYFTEVTRNHTALLFQWSYSKITSRCYFTEVTLIFRNSRYLRNASKNEEVNTEIIKELLALFPFPPTF